MYSKFPGGRVSKQRINGMCKVLLRNEVELDKRSLSSCIDEGEGVDSEALHHTI